MKYKQAIWLVMVFMLSILATISYAEIKINEPVQGNYNLGDKLSISVQFTPQSAVEGLIKSNLNCGDKSILYYAAPMKVASGGTISHNIPSLTFTNYMLGQCSVTITVSSFDNSFLDERTVTGITVTKDLILTLNEIPDTLPGEQATFKGTLKNARGLSPEKAELKIRFNDQDYSIPFTEGEFAYNTQIPEKINSGIYTVRAFASDEFGNSGEATARFKIPSKATSIEIFPKEETYLPGQSIELTPVLLDQVRKIMEDSVAVEIISPSGNKVFSSDVASNTLVSHKLDDYSEPGVYQIKASKEAIVNTRQVTVSTVEKLEVSMEGNNISIKNTGNVEYNNITTIIAESEGKKYAVNKKVILMPGQIVKFDLSEDIKGGSYSINVEPSKEIKITYIESNGQSEAGLQNISIVSPDSFFTKAVKGISGITGSFLGAQSKASVVYAVGLLALIIITSAVILGYQSTKQQKKKNETIKSEDNAILLDDDEGEGYVSLDNFPKKEKHMPKQEIKADNRKKEIDSMLDKHISKKFGWNKS